MTEGFDHHSEFLDRFADLDHRRQQAKVRDPLEET